MVSVSVREPDFVDAQQMAERHPQTFGAPQSSVLEALKTGSLVKVCSGSERYWVKLTAVRGEKLTGTVDNDLLDPEECGCDFGDTVRFERKHVYSVWGE